MFLNVNKKKSLKVFLFFLSLTTVFIFLILHVLSDCTECRYSNLSEKESRNIFIQHFKDSFPRIFYDDPIHLLNLEPSGDKKFDPIKETKLPIANLKISPDQEIRLNDQIPIFEKSSYQFSLQDFKWDYGKAILSIDDQISDVDLRFRGWNHDHYRLPFKKSWRLKPKNKYFYGLDSFNLINQRTHCVVDDVYQYETLVREGFITMQQKMVHMRANDKYVGIQTFLEQPSNKWFSRRNLPIGPIYGEKRWFFTNKDRNNMDNWSIYTGEGLLENNYQPLKRLFSALDNSDDEQIMDLVDIDQMTSYFADATITKKLNPSSHNHRYYFDPKKGKFQILPWYQQGYLQCIQGYRERPYELVLNDFFFSIFNGKKERFFDYQKLLWEKINSNYHPHVLKYRLTQFYHGTKIDRKADIHLHDYVLKKYVSYDEHEKRLGYFFKSIDKDDENLRKSLSEMNIKVDESRITDNKIKIIYNSLPPIQLEKVCLLNILKNNDKNTFNLEIRTNSDNKKVKSKLVKNKICFNTSLKIHPDFKAVGYSGDERNRKNFAAAGLYVKNFSIPGVEVATVFEANPFVINLTIDKDLNLDVNVKVKLIYQNLVTGMKSDEDINSFVMKSLEKDKKNTSYWEKYDSQIDFKINKHNTYEKSLGLKRWNTISKNKNFIKKVFKKNSTYKFDEDVIFESNIDILIEEGVKIILENNSSILIKGSLNISGTSINPVIISSKNLNDPFGSIIISNGNGKKNSINYLKLSNGSQARMRFVEYLGALSVYGADIDIRNSTFTSNVGTDTVNIVYSNFNISNSTFSNSKDDCLDIDFSEGSLKNNIFENCGGDGIDFSYSNLTVASNSIINVADKGISVGEKTKAEIFNNEIKNSIMGIAVKDASIASITNNKINNSQFGLSSYIKKGEIGPPSVCTSGNIFTNVKTNFNFIDYINLIKNDINTCNGFVNKNNI
jgi:hypothetical protein